MELLADDDERGGRNIGGSWLPSDCTWDPYNLSVVPTLPTADDREHITGLQAEEDVPPLELGSSNDATPLHNIGASAWIEHTAPPFTRPASSSDPGPSSMLHSQLQVRAWICFVFQTMTLTTRTIASAIHTRGIRAPVLESRPIESLSSEHL
jgi:hypothetical protein